MGGTGTDPRVALFVRDPSAAGDEQASWRVTVLARARLLEQPELEQVHARYCARVPNAPSYLGTHDFTYFALDPLRVRAIVGFGREIEAAEAREVFGALARDARAKVSG